ncbi:MAG TPA: glycoside hydrolase family 2 TIM barrel-domain containing protein [Bacteroidales bacterium]|nr:glycoside hydrolase family 2 [Bacteroidales bacterium]HNR41811.1 glycoside hydrolase family 2 TIM barrel-domain containing protein [Bacteroidales bacterium]HPM18783.1 glycoside hydrolase family 2 TIM barrel-domain containing protein [Bacteroidales bacterium]
MKPNLHYPVCRFALLILLASVLLSCSGKKETASVILLGKEWQIKSSLKTEKGGEELSAAGVEEPGWYRAEVPSTVFGSLVKNGIYGDVFFGKNLEKADPNDFKSSWWYRKSFRINNDGASNWLLEFDGIIYRANIWLNGSRIASSDTLAGPFRQFSFNVTGLIRKDGENYLAVEVFPPAAGDLTVGFVDWNPEAPDRGMGLWREVRLRSTGVVSLKYPFVLTRLDTATLKHAELTVTCEATNNGSRKTTGYAEVSIGDGIRLKQKVKLEPGEKKLVTFKPDDYPALKLENPRVWWTHDLGSPELYDLEVRFTNSGAISDKAATHFGIRDISWYTYPKYGREHKGYRLNGRKILVKGGGWVDQLFLMPDSLKLERQIAYVKHMNMNAIRPEGFWGNNHDMYDICDREGILIMTGWSCQWEWPEYCGKEECDELYGCIQTPEEIELISRSWRDMIKWLRNHPSIFMWMTGSDMLPLPELEKKYIAILAEDDPSRPMVTSASMRKSTISGWSGMKMEGPYEYVPPVYWYIDTIFGGAYGFNTETGPGAQVPPVESMREMIPAELLWPINDTWEYHCGRHAFNTLDRYNTAMNERFGKPSSLEEYCTKAQMLNYESVRPMFEAFQVNRYDATGIIQWMLNSSWPKLIWQLYGFDLLPNGAFYGTRKALQPLQAIYDYGKNEIVVTNSSPVRHDNLMLRIKVFNLNMKELLSREISFGLAGDDKKAIFRLPDQIKGLDPTYFLDLRIVGVDGENLAINQYLLTQTKHEFDWGRTYFVHTPTRKHQNLRQINGLPDVKLESKLIFTPEDDKMQIIIEVENHSGNLAHSVELMLLEAGTGHFVAPVYLDDNYFSLLPGERRVIKGYCYLDDLNDTKLKLKVSGLNIK